MAAVDVSALIVLMEDPVAWSPGAAGALYTADRVCLWSGIADSEEALLADMRRHLPTGERGLPFDIRYPVAA